MGGGSQVPFGHPGSQDGTIPEPYGVDPSIAPGLARIQGWRVALPDGSGAWDKVGPLDTDWQLVGSGAPGDVTGLLAGDPGIVLTNPGGPVVTVGQIVAAEWTIDRCRVYAVDFVSGNDANAGFADPTATGAAAYALACAAAGAAAKKTFAGLAAIFPRVGNGRLAEIVIANGGSNTEQLYVGGLDTFLADVVGYGSACPLVRATGTNTTAGCTKFDGSTADADYLGAITATGCNTAGYNPVAAFSTSVIKCLKVGGGAAAIPAEPAAPLGWRLRFDAATTTAALRNVCRQVAQVSGTDTAILQTVLPAAPVGTDTFYFEQAGVACAAYSLGGGTFTPASLPQIAGIRSTGTANFRSCEFLLAMSGANQLATTSGSQANALQIAQLYAHPVLGTRTVGGGFRSETTINLRNGTFTSVKGAVAVTGFTGFQPINLAWDVGNYSGGLLTVQNASLSSGTSSGTAPTIGSSTALASPRLPRIQWTASKGQIGGCTIAGAGASPAISVTGQCVVSFDQGVCAGTTGNNDVGLDLTLSRGSLIILTTTPTVTGALGDVRLAGGQIITWAQAIATGIADSAGNRIYGTAGTPPLGMDTKSGAILSGVAAAASWMADDSWTSLVALGANNNVFQQRWPTSLRLMTRLRLMLCNPEPTAQAVSATLYKNGVATAMTCTLPIGSMNFDKVVDAAHPILFLDGDDWAVRLNTGIMGAEGPTLYLCTATVEWAT